MPHLDNIKFSNAEVRQILEANGHPFQLGLWERIKDFFRGGTKQELILRLVREMQASGPASDITLYLDNFEKIVAHAKPEQLHQFQVVLQHHYDPDHRHAAHPVWPAARPGGQMFVTFHIGDETLEPAVNLDRSFYELDAYCALVRLRGQIAREGPDQHLGKFATTERVQERIDRCLNGEFGRARMLFGTLLRELVAQITDAANALEERPGQDMQREAAAMALMELQRINEVLVETSLPRFMVFALIEPQRAVHLDLRVLVDRDADFGGANLALLQKAGGNFNGVAVRTLLDQNAVFAGVDIARLCSAGADFSDVTLRELIEKGAVGGGYRLGLPREDQLRSAPPPHHAIEVDDLAVDGSHGKLKLTEMYRLGFNMKDVSLSRLLLEFDVHDARAEHMLNDGVRFRPFDVKDLSERGILFDSTSANTWIEQEVSFGNLTIEALMDLGIDVEGAKLAELLRLEASSAGCDAALLVKKHIDLTGVQFNGFTAAGGVVSNVNIRDLIKANMSFDGTSFRDLVASHVQLDERAVRELFGRVDLAGVNLADLLAAGLSLKGVKAADLVKHDVSFAGAKLAGLLLDEELDFGGCALLDLMESCGADFADVPLAVLKQRGASFAGLTWRALDGQGANFKGLRFADLVEFGPDFARGLDLEEIREFVDLTGVTVGQLDEAGIMMNAYAEFSALRRMNVDFGKMPVTSLLEVARRGCAADLLKENAGLQQADMQALITGNVNINRTELFQLIDAGAKVAGIEAIDLVGRGVYFDRFNPDRLAEKKIVAKGAPLYDMWKRGFSIHGVPVRRLLDLRMNFTGMPLLVLKAAGALFDNTTFGELQRANVVFDMTAAGTKEKLRVRDLPEGISLSGMTGPLALLAELDLSAAEDAIEFERRGGVLLVRMQPPQKTR